MIAKNAIEGKRAFLAEETKELFSIYLGSDATAYHSVQDCFHLPKEVGWSTIAIAVGADLLRRNVDPTGQAALALTLTKLRNDTHDVPGMLRQAIAALGDQEPDLIEAMASCSADGFWLNLAIEVAGVDFEQGKRSRNRLLESSMLRLIDRERQHFQLHPLVREQIRTSMTPTELEALRERHFSSVEKLFREWEARWEDCQQCIAEAISAINFSPRAAIERTALPYLTLGDLKQRFVRVTLLLHGGFWRRGEGLWSSRKGRGAAEGFWSGFTTTKAGILSAWGHRDQAKRVSWSVRSSFA